MLVSRQGDRDFVKVLDFGLAKVAPETLALEGKAAEQALTKHGTVFGTPKYMAPEQCVCQPADARTDLYALGWILFEMLTGVHPFSAKDVLTIVRHQLSTPTPAMQSVAPAVQVPAALEAVVQRLTDKRPEHRYPSAAAARAALAAVAAQADAATPPSRAAEPPAGLSPFAQSDAAKTVASVELVSALDVPTPNAAPAAALAATPAISEAAALAAPPAAAAAAPVATAAAATTAAGSAGAAAAAAPAVAAAPAGAAAAPDRVAAATPPGAAAAAPLAAGPAEAVGRDAVPAFLARLPPPLQKRPALLLVPVALLGLGLVWLLHTPAVPGPKTSAGRPAAARAMAQSAPAPQGQLEQAIAAGAPELLNLAKAFPGDARVKRALAHTHMAQHNGMEALRWLAKVTALDANLVQEGEILQAAKLAFSRPEQADDAIAFLETELGERGVDALYLLAVRPGPIRLKLKFNQSLAKPEVRRRASRAALVAMDLRAAGPCEQKRALLPRATQYGDRRTLQQLQWLAQKQNCGPFGLADCGACLRQDGALQNTIKAIAARVGADN